MTYKSAFPLALATLLALAGCDCSDDPGTGPTDGGVDPTLDGWIPDTDGGPVRRLDGGVVITEDGGFTFTCYEVLCNGKILECGDCIDNDGDGRIDFRDRECLGPCDNTEGPQLTTGVGGEGGTSCNRDCYFDFGNGSGNDTCRWDTLCDPLAPDVECPYEMDELGGNRCPDNQSAQCLQLCRPVTPNGCDCFGCCTFDELAGRSEAEGGEWVWLGSGVGEGPDGEGTCTFDLLGDTDMCKPCIPVEDCFNDCGRCEICLGRDTLPPECDPGMYDGGVPDGGVYRCEPGVQLCGQAGEADCPQDYYCLTGCCAAILF